MAEACRQMAIWRELYPQTQFTMRVNMSPAQLSTRDIVRLVADRLSNNHFPGSALCLEITEHAVMQDVQQAVQALRDLKSLGVSLAIDDFGTGHSSMSQLLWAATGPKDICCPAPNQRQNWLPCSYGVA
jgi:EAL domain-containing protein (putative c-di-GMP-specific phosphodiesterase class I)